MAQNLKKFVNDQFLQTAPLALLRRLLERHAGNDAIDLSLFDEDPTEARAAIGDLLRGPEEALPEQLVVDLHRAAELGNRNGLELLLQQARRANIPLTDTSSRETQDPKHVALTALLDAPEVFEAAVNVLALYQRTGVAEFVGPEEGVEAQIDPENLAALRDSAAVLLEADLHGQFCKIDWYEDGPEINLVIAHGAPVVTTPIVVDGAQTITTQRMVEQAVLSYSAVDGRLKMIGVKKARRAELAGLVAHHILERPGFFASRNAQRLYTLEPVEREWADFRLRHQFDRTIRRSHIVEVRVDKVACDLFGRTDKVEWSFVARDSSDCALARMRSALPELEFASGQWRLGHLVIRLHIDTGGQKTSTVTVKIKPEASASFRRQRFEGQVLDLLRQNGFCCDRPDQPPLAAE